MMTDFKLEIGTQVICEIGIYRDRASLGCSVVFARVAVKSFCKIFCFFEINSCGKADMALEALWTQTFTPALQKRCHHVLFSHGSHSLVPNLWPTRLSLLPMRKTLQLLQVLPPDAFLSVHVRIYNGSYIPFRPQHKVQCVHTELQNHAGSLQVYDYKVKRVNVCLHPLARAIEEQSVTACLQAKTAIL